jgi:hypothetical protein
VTLAAWGPTAYKPAAVKRTLRDLKVRQHVDTVTIIVVWMQDNLTAVTVRPGSETAPDKNIRAAIRAAKQLNMRVILRPYVDLVDGQWRGDLRPTSVPGWFASYDRFILRYATLARVERADGFVVGSEMSTLSVETGRWRALVRNVRRRFSGFVTYQANWGGEEFRLDWWDALDAISISAYYPLAAAPGTGADELASAWSQLTDQYGIDDRWYPDIDTLRQRWNRPVMFGEIGYQQVPKAAVEPWNTTLTGTDTKIQDAAYEAAFRVWYRVPWFRGMHWWYVAPDPGLVDGRAGADHQPGGAALRTLRTWYAQGR